jgi:DNA-binding GntR family transcriptional regulator
MTTPQPLSTTAEWSPDPRSLGEKAYQLLVSKIIRLELPPGAPLIEKALSADLGIGRTPIREALYRLAGEGLVNHHPNRGMFVAEISATSVQHIYEFRLLIDRQTARLAAQRATPMDAHELRGLHLKLVKATDDDSIELYVEYDRRFYEVLARVARNIYLAEVMQRMFNLHLRLWFLISKRLGTWHGIARAHEEMTKAIVDAIAKHDPEQAEKAIETYITQRQKQIYELL